MGQKLADLGSGSGFYTLAGGKIVGEQGEVYSIDVLEAALDHTVAEARLKNIRNIKTLVADLEQSNSCSQIPLGSVDMVLLANIVHQLKQRENIFKEAYRILKTGGKLVVIEWNDQPSPIGPKSSERIAENEIENLAAKTTFKKAGKIDVDFYHYGLNFIK
jgi:ubiquinone/menaquinone biosynthesis C-methylase UbiE